MKIKSIYISQGMFCTERFLSLVLILFSAKRIVLEKQHLCVAFYMDLAMQFQGQEV